MKIAVNYNAMGDDELLKLVIKESKNGQMVDNVLENKQLHELFFDTSPEELVRIMGSGRVKAEQLMALQVLIKRLVTTSSKKITKISNPQDVYNYLKPLTYGQKREHFITIMLDTKNKIIKSEVISIGTLNASLVHPREVFNECIRMSACSLIIAHNHPSGVATPSLEDRNITQRLVEAGKIIGISVVDHIIVADNDYYSFKENGEI